MPDYVTQAAFDLYVRDKIGATTATEAALLVASLAAAEQAVNEYCVRNFVVVAVDAVATARVFIPDGTQRLLIDDARAVTSVSVDSTAVDSTLYQLEPLNNLSASGAYRPHERIFYLDSRWPISTRGKASVSVTARWGWAAVPAAVTEATKIIGKDIVQQRQTVGNLAAVGDIATSVRLNTYVRELLRPFIHPDRYGIA